MPETTANPLTTLLISIIREMEKYGFQCGNFHVHKTKPHLILLPPNLVKMIGTLSTYFAEVLTYRRVVLAGKSWRKIPLLGLFLDCGV